MGKLRRHTRGADIYQALYSGGGRRAWSLRGGVQNWESGGLHESAGDTVHTPGIAQRKSGTDRFFHEDWLGSTRFLTDAGGLNAPFARRYDAWGNETAALGGNDTDLRFAGAHGYRSDAPGGLQLLGHRYYDSSLGRFISPDPIGHAGGLNLYAYCENDPVGAVDPRGLSPFDIGDEDSDDDITYWGRRNTKRLLSGGFHAKDTAYANRLHQQAGLAPFRSGNRPLAMDAFNIHQTVGGVGAGGPALRCLGAGRGAGGSKGPKLWVRFKNWLGGLLVRKPATPPPPMPVRSFFHKGNLASGKVKVRSKPFSTGTSVEDVNAVVVGDKPIHRFDIPASTLLEWEKRLWARRYQTQMGDRIIEEWQFGSPVHGLLERYRTRVR